MICLPSEVICASPESDCSSRRRRPSFVSHRRPSAPEVSAEEVPGSEPEGSRLFLNVMRAVRPSWLGALIASLIAWASAFGRGDGAGAAERGRRDRGGGDEDAGAREDREQAPGGGRAQSSHAAVVRPDLESSLIAGSSMSKRAPSHRHAAAVALGDRAHDRQAEARALAAGARPAPEALEGVLQRGGVEARALVGDADPSARSPARATVTVIAPPAGPCTRALRTRLATARSSASRSPSTSAPSSHDDPRVRIAGHRRAGDLLQRDRLAGQRRRRILARQREQVVEQRAQPRRVGLDVGEHGRVGAVLGHVGGVAAQRGERRAQLVRGVGDEALLGRARPLAARRASR